MAGAVKVERELNTKLPGTVESADSVDFVDEQIISIASNGEVALNDEPADEVDSAELPSLKGTLMRLKQNADAAKSTLMVTIVGDPQAKYRAHDQRARRPGVREDRRRHLPTGRGRIDGRLTRSARRPRMPSGAK